MDTNAFDILSNEVISHIIAYLDAVSLFRFCGCSKRLLEFNNISNEHWRILYSIQWLVDDQELRLYEDKDWRQYFKSRYTLEKNLVQNDDNSQPHEKFIGRLVEAGTTTELLTALDTMWEINNGVSIPFVATALLKLIRTNELPMTKAVVKYVTLMNGIIGNAVQGYPLELTGAYSVAVELLDTKYSEEILLHTLKLVQTCNTLTSKIDVIGMYTPLRSRLLDVFEKSSSFDLVKNAMDAFNSRAIIGNRPVICQKICQAIDQSLDPALDASSKENNIATVKDFIKSLVPDNSEFMVAQGVLEKLFVVIPKLNSAELFSSVMRAIEEFAYEETTSKQIVKNEEGLNSVLNHAKYLRRKSHVFKELAIFGSIFGLFYALIYSHNVGCLFNSPYLEFVLPYLAREDVGADVFFEICHVLSDYVRYGIETLRLNSIHKRIEPYFQLIIDSRLFKHSITLWQTLYCGMKLPLDMAKTLIKRIIPELPLETDKRFKRPYAELLANMVQVDGAPFLDIDMKLLYDHYSQELIIDDRTNDPSIRAKVPYASNFITAGASVPQFAELAIKDEKLLEKMYSLYDEKEEVETLFTVVSFFGHVVRIPGWDNRKGLEILERWGTTMPLNTPMYYMFTMINYFMHLFERDNPVEVLCFGTWIIARMSQRQDGRDGLKQLSSDTIEWLSSHSDPRLRKNMESYHQNIYRAQMGYVDEF